MACLDFGTTWFFRASLSQQLRQCGISTRLTFHCRAKSERLQSQSAQINLILFPISSLSLQLMIVASLQNDRKNGILKDLDMHKDVNNQHSLQNQTSEAPVLLFSRSQDTLDCPGEYASMKSAALLPRTAAAQKKTNIYCRLVLLVGKKMKIIKRKLLLKLLNAGEQRER